MQGKAEVAYRFHRPDVGGSSPPPSKRHVQQPPRGVSWVMQIVEIGALAQSVEHLSCKQDVGGSIPPRSTNISGFVV